jgi:hypothetical protein
VYTFHCNGDFIASRTGVRRRTTRLSDRYAYFSKVEVSFHGTTGTAPTRKQTIAATRDLFEYLLPVLIEEHWPDWDARAGEPSGERSPAPVGTDPGSRQSSPPRPQD